MLLWPAAGAVFATYNVFQTSGLDYRLVALGALAPLVVDATQGQQWIGHTLLAPTVVMTAVMLVTARRGLRLRRRRLIGIAVGWYAGLVLLAAWRTKEIFWWPAFGFDVPDVALLAPWPVVVVLELLGLVALRWIWIRFGLADRARRQAFVRTGRLTAAT